MDNLAIMEPTRSTESIGSIPDLLFDAEKDLTSINIFEDYSNADSTCSKNCVLLLDSDEVLRISNVSAFIKKLGITDENKSVKVVSIFGNSGDGKSHTMNHVFFGGQEIFKTSSEQNSCTLGVSCGFQQSNSVLCLDTEGFNGPQNENKRMRMLLKVLAISDIIIYRTRAERIHSEMFNFLATANKVWWKHFSPVLNPSTPTKTLGPDVVIFHETRNTRPLESTIEEGAEQILRRKFAELKLDIDAFNSLRYVGIRTEPTDSTNYSILREILKIDLENAARRPRSIKNVLKLLQSLNDKFSGEVKETVYTFHEEHFTCGMVCESCNCLCENTKDHSSTGTEHQNSRACQYQQHFDNKIFLCKKCHLNGRRVVVKLKNHSASEGAWIGIAKYAWNGYTIDCPYCGEIYRSRQYWYGNKTPEESSVISESVHVWKDSAIKVHGQTHSAQVIVDGFNYLTETITTMSAQPTSAISSWLADKIAPDYWRPNSEIINCKACKLNFGRTGLKIHHCRKCGEGFCNSCSRNRMPVPSRGWTDPVRVCNGCRDELRKGTENGDIQDNLDDDTSVRVRKCGEVLVNTLSSVASVLEYPKDFIKESARPDYWVPDSEAPHCSICNQLFGNFEDLDKTHLLYQSSTNIDMNKDGSSPSSPVHKIDRKIHHCRQCGNAVCNKCSQSRKPVPERGWIVDVRVCDVCFNMKPN